MSNRIRLFLVFFLTFFLGCQTLDAILGVEEGFDEDETITLLSYKNTQPVNRPPVYVRFTPDAGNTGFHMKEIAGKTVVLLPIRSGMGGGGSEDIVTDYMTSAFNKIVKGVKFISDRQADEMFTDLDMWDQYFSFIEEYTKKGVSAGKDLVKVSELYSKLKADYVITATADYRFHSIAGLYPRAFNIYISIQIWDLKNKQKIWGGICNGDSKADSPQDEPKITHEMADRVAQHIFYKLITYI